MSEPRKVRVLTRLRINEVSAVDRGAGENCKVVISKRDDDYNPEPLTVQERARAKYEGRNALRDAEDIEARAKRDGDARRDELYDLITGRTSVLKLYGVAEDEPADNHDAEEPAPAVTKSNTPKEPSPMSLDLSEVVKVHGIGALCRHFVKSNSSFGVDEHQLVKLATEDASRRYPSDTPEMAFTKLYTDSAELRDAIEIAKGAAFQDSVSEALERDSREAMEELTKIGKARWPSLTPSQRFARAFETNPELAKRAHRRPGPSTSFPQPVAKMPLVNVDNVTLTPQYVTEADPNSAEKALAQLKALGRQKWPTLSEAQAFLNAVTDPENAPLVRAALHVPTGSSPARQ